jgi:hypothetical protein
MKTKEKSIVEILMKSPSIDESDNFVLRLSMDVSAKEINKAIEQIRDKLNEG